LAVGIVHLLAGGNSNLMTQVAVSGTVWALFAAAHAYGRLAAARRREPQTDSSNWDLLRRAPGVGALRAAADQTAAS
jgi:hypothetical protein